MSYDNPTVSTYTLPAATVSAAATLLSVIGPEGHKGALLGIGAVVTTGVTVAAAEIQVGDAGDADQYGTLSIPVASAAESFNAATISAVDDNIMPADTAVLIGSDGGSTAGAADLMVTIAWFK